MQQLPEKTSAHLTPSLLLPAILSFVLLPSLANAQAVTTAQYDNARTGTNLNEKILTPANVSVSQFGKLFTFEVDGDVYAQPLYVPDVEVPDKGKRNLLFIATENDSVYAFDADGTSTTPLWHVSLADSAKNASRHFSQLGRTGMKFVRIGSCEIVSPGVVV